MRSKLHVVNARLNARPCTDGVARRRLERALPGPVRALHARLEQAGFGAAIVGGAIRDAYLGREIADWDVATDASLDVVAALFARVVPVGGAFGTVLVLTRAGPVQVSTLRGVQTRSAGGLAGAAARIGPIAAFEQRLGNDLAHRDLTINAMAWLPRSGRIADLYGGARDLRRGVLRAVGAADERLREDPVRVLRVLRLQATLGLRIDARTAAAMRRAAVTTTGLAGVAWERKRDELLRLLAGGHPAGLRHALARLRSTGLLAALAPELAAAPQTALGRAAGWPGGDAELRLALWAAAGCVPADQLAALTRRWLLSRRQQRRVLAVAAALQMLPPPPFAASALRRWVARHGVPATAAAARLAGWLQASPPWRLTARRLPPKLARLLRGDPCLRLDQLAVRGDELRAHLGIDGRAIGGILEALLGLVLDHPRMNRRAILLDRAAKLSTGLSCIDRLTSARP